jgi:hypothetical protein
MMDKYVVSWTEEIWQKVIIEAESEEEARELFYYGEFNIDSVKVTGGEIQDGVDINKLEGDR